MTTSPPRRALAAAMRSSGEPSGTSRYLSKSQPTPFSFSGTRIFAGWGSPASLPISIRVSILAAAIAAARLKPILSRLGPDFQSPLSADIDHRPGGRHEVRLVDAVALLLFHHYLLDEFHELLVACPAAQERLEVVIFLAEQAGAQLSGGGGADGGGGAGE